MFEFIEQFLFPKYVPLLVEFANLHDAHSFDGHLALVGFLVGQAYFTKRTLTNYIFDDIVVKFLRGPG